MNKFTIILLGFCVVFSACSSAPKKTAANSEQQANPSYLKLQVYGNWCGLDYPKNLTFLSTPPKAIDGLDEACKRHDYCYLEKGNFSCECDKTIVEEIDNALVLNEIKGSSRHIARSIRTHFQGSPCEGDSRTKALPSHLLHRVYHNVKGAVGGLVNKVWSSDDTTPDQNTQQETIEPEPNTSSETNNLNHEQTPITENANQEKPISTESVNP